LDEGERAGSGEVIYAGPRFPAERRLCWTPRLPSGQNPRASCAAWRALPYRRSGRNDPGWVCIRKREDRCPGGSL